LYLQKEYICTLNQINIDFNSASDYGSEGCRFESCRGHD